MMEPEDNLEEKLRQALPLQTGREEFRMELKEKLMRLETSRLPERHQRKQPGFSLRAYALGGIAAALALAFLVGPALLPQRELAPLPPLAAIGPETQGAAAGPGFTVELNYTLTGALGVLPAEAPVYRHEPMPFSPDTVKATADKLGIAGEVTTDAWQDKYTYSIGSANDRYLMAFPDGYYSYNRMYPDNQSGMKLPDETELTGAAEIFIKQLGINPAGIELQRIDYPESDEVPATAMLFYVPRQPGNQVSVAPYIAVRVGTDKEVYNAGWIWPAALTQTVSYPLRTADEAWAAVQAGKGKLVIEYRDILGPAEGTAVYGSGKVETVKVGYILTYAETGEVVLQPVAAFSGTATLEDGMTLPFTVYTEAVDQKYYQE